MANANQRIFWLCHLGGWGALTLLNLIVRTASLGAFHLAELVGSLAIFSSGAFFTWLCRRVIKHYRWLDWHPALLVAAGLATTALAGLATVITGLLLTDLALALFLGLAPEFSPALVAGNFAAITPFVFIWFCLYFTIGYLRRWQQKTLYALQLENSLKDAQLNALYGQINPHFMFNCLNNIRALMLEDVDRARDMLTQLSLLLRHGLTDASQWVSLTDELKIVNATIQLAEIQFEERLRFQSQINITSDKIIVPRMMLQLLIENALKHGIGETPSGGELLLLIEEHDNQLHIKVRNPGRLNASQTQRGFGTGAGTSTRTGTGIGIRNIEQRLKLLYDDQAFFSLTESQGVVTAELHLPTGTEAKFP
ncbi:sensor histidine kinase [Simiduia agarivorans]|uniref:Signal transduction histidine kinase n=1 Tax=Simiduia agarivorans (strain DSM 21679 / JCM 13881 / BCRC 17597 / SA1) TaxID=1117647 RepID=K4KP86_SIMAS|nr:histidine kinase [Simiduia agarivorans]AFV00051.1 putative signal transduction histidine kinase [Simiduia agarivorans SA1 = DSM 21679]